MAGVDPLVDAGVGGEAMESILAGGERAKNGGDADEARSAAVAAVTDVVAVAVLADYTASLPERHDDSKDKSSISMLTDGVSK